MFKFFLFVYCSIVFVFFTRFVFLKHKQIINSKSLDLKHYGIVTNVPEVLDFYKIDIEKSLVYVCVLFSH